MGVITVMTVMGVMGVITVMYDSSQERLILK